MNLRQFEVFRMVVETGSVTEAAGRLHVSQPAVSKMLAQLERDLGFRAFLRERRRLVLTAEGRALYNEVERAFVGLEYLTRFACDLKGLRRGHLVLGAPHSASSGWLPSVMSAFLRQHQGLSLSLQTMDSTRVAQAVASGHLDVGIIHFEVAMPQVQRERLASVEAVCVLHPRHRLARKRVIRPADLNEEPFIALAPVDRYRLKLDTLLEAEGISQRIQIDTPLGSAACALVMEGMGITIVDQLTAEDNLHRGIVVRPFAPRIAEDLVVLTPTRRPAAVITGEFIAMLRARFAPAGHGVNAITARPAASTAVATSRLRATIR